MKITFLRVLIFFLALIPIIFWNKFFQEITLHFTGSVNTITNNWLIVVLNIIAFVAFLIPLTYRRKANWAEKGIVIAFFISLFVEMYGIPLSLFFASTYLFKTPQAQMEGLFSINFLGTDFLFGYAMTYASVLIIIGTILIAVGWITLYKNIKKEKLVTSGIYKYSRHPQYLGFLLVILGWFFGWPTLLVTIFAPILLIVYLRVCFIEEKEMEKQFKEYKKYKQKAPLLL